jgi:hypothetical protein
LAIIHMLLFHNNGYAQINCQRFSLDFLPILVILVALGTQRAGDRLWKVLSACSILLNVFSPVVLPLLSN